jgi:hypothetical protein
VAMWCRHGWARFASLVNFKISKMAKRTRLLPAMAALTGEVLLAAVVSAFAGGLLARAALSVRSIAFPEGVCDDCEPERGL